MSVGEFTASNIAMDVDARDEKKAGTVDMAKLTADIQAQRDLAAKARMAQSGSPSGIALPGFQLWAHPPPANRHAPCCCGLVQGQLHAALEGLLGLEKMSRLAEDITAAKASCSAILDLCYAAKDWKLLEEHVSVLTKRRSQLKQVTHGHGGLEQQVAPGANARVPSCMVTCLLTRRQLGFVRRRSKR